jgi:hypothetical protein
MNMRITVIYHVTLASVPRVDPEDGSSMYIWNLGISVPHYTASHPRRS